MPKNKLTEYDSTAANNTDVGGVNLAENSMLPSDVNNAFREVLSHLKDFADGTEAVNAVAVDNLKLDGNTLSSTNTNGNVIVSPNGTGNVEIAKDLQLNGTTNNWTVEVDSNDHLIFKYNGTGVLKIEDNGHITSANDVTGFGTI